MAFLSRFVLALALVAGPFFKAKAFWIQSAAVYIDTSQNCPDIKLAVCVLTPTHSGYYLTTNMVSHDSTASIDLILNGPGSTLPSLGFICDTLDLGFLKAGNYTAVLNYKNSKDKGDGLLESLTLSFSVPHVQNFTVCDNSTLAVRIDSVVDITCREYADGMAWARNSGGVGVTELQWSNGMHGAFNLGLDSGDHQIYVRDQNCCIASDDFYVSAPEKMIDYVTADSVLCYGTNTGRAELVGTSAYPYAISWSDGGVGTLNPDLAAGYHKVFTVDSSGCQDSSQIFIGQPDSIQYWITYDDFICSEDSFGRAFVTAAGGTPPYTIHWDHNTNPQPSFTLLRPGNHTVLVKDKNGCEAINVFDIYEYETPVKNGILGPLVHQGQYTYWVSADLPVVNVLWQYGSGTWVSETDTTLVIQGPTGAYKIDYSYQDQEGCNYSLSADYDLTSIGLTPDLKAFRIFPNPSSEVLFLDGLEEERIRVINASGQIMDITPRPEGGIEVSSYPAGSYFILVEREAQVVALPFTVSH